MKLSIVIPTYNAHEWIQGCIDSIRLHRPAPPTDYEIIGVVSNANSLVGSTLHDFDYVKVVPLTNGNYVVCNGVWDNGSAVDVGAFGAGA